MKVLELLLEILQIRLFLLVRLQLIIKMLDLSLILDLHGLKGPLISLRKLSLELVESIVVHSQLLPHLFILLLETLDLYLTILQFLLHYVDVVEFFVAFTSETFEHSLHRTSHVVAVLEVGHCACNDLVASSELLERFTGKLIEYLKTFVTRDDHSHTVTIERLVARSFNVHREFRLFSAILLADIYEVREEKEV